VAENLGLSRSAVARLAGVSPRTVTNVVNGYAHVSPETRQRVQDAIDALGYRTNAAARTLRTGRTGVIGLVVPAIDQPYFAALARSVIAQAAAEGYTVVVEQTEGDPDRERVLLRGGPIGAMFDGLIISPLALTSADLQEAGTRQDPVVLLGERTVAVPLDRVVFDNVAAARQATEHLIAQGRRRIAAIGIQVPDEGGTASLRKAGFIQALKAAGLPIPDDYLRRVETVTRASGREQMAQLLKCQPRPDAVFCFTDLLAIGALRACFEAGVMVPDEVAIIGFDDIEESAYTNPSLSTVRPDLDEIARLAFGSLLSRITNNAAGPREAAELVAPYQLVIRESTGG